LQDRKSVWIERRSYAAPGAAFSPEIGAASLRRVMTAAEIGNAIRDTTRRGKCPR